MQSMSHPVIKDVVLIGAGHAHVQVLKRFGMKPLPGVRFTLITREVHTPYSGMLPGLVAGRYSFDEAHIDTGPLARFAGARLYQSAAVGIDLKARRVICDNRPPVPYDLLSINTGSTPNTVDVPGASEHAIPVKPIDRFLGHLDALLKRIEANGDGRRIVLVGAGAGGVELLLSLEARLRRQAVAAGRDPARLSFTLLSATPDILPGFPLAFQKRFRDIFAARGIEVLTNARVIRVEPGALQIEGGVSLAADEILWTTEAHPPDWLKSTGLALDERGFVKVDASLLAEGQTGVFAAGDIIAFTPRPLPKSGVYSVRTGPVLAENLRRTLTGQPLVPYKPQREAMYLISTGEDYAVGTRNGIVFAGKWVWRWKDRIDRRFMAKFNELPEMKAQAEAASPLADKEAIKEISAIAMRCGGCGAKVGANVLTRALGGIEPAERQDVLVGLDAPDDAAIVDMGGNRLAVHSVDYFRAMIDDPYLFGKIAANHALGDIFAMGAEPQSALAIATLPYGLEAKVEADLAAMMQGANEALHEAGCALVGGHTSEGAEMALGFAVNGLAERDRFLRKGGMEAGDVLILTKPIGTGTLLAADMRGKAKARWVMAAVRHMMQSNYAAAKILNAHGAHAATDITGFGLLGHLVEMVKASGVDVSVALHALPLLPGVRETLGLGIFSSLQPQNVRLRRAIRNLGEVARAPLYPALFDPQTAGGLLASVPSTRAEACLKALHEAGYGEAAIIGAVAPPSDVIEPITIVLGEKVTSGMPVTNGRDEKTINAQAEPLHANQSLL